MTPPNGSQGLSCVFPKHLDGQGAVDVLPGENGVHVEVPVRVVIDFGQTRPDLFLYDFVALVSHWDDSEMETAFFAGYGRSLEPAERQTLLGLVSLHAMGSIAWAQTHGAERAGIDGRRLLGWVATRL